MKWQWRPFSMRWPGSRSIGLEPHSKFRQGAPMIRKQTARELGAPLSLLLSLLLGASRLGAGQTYGVGPRYGQVQNPFSGSVPTGQATGTTLDLSLKEAL